MNLKGIIFFCLCISVGYAIAPKKIIRGDYANQGFAHQVFIEDIKRDYSCGGVMIHYTHILTAAHCVYSGTPEVAKPEYLKVSTGFLDSQAANYYNVYDVAEIIVHPHYNSRMSRKAKLFADIAILKLTQTMVFTAVESPILLTSRETPPNKTVVASGWGTTHYINGKIVRDARWLQKLEMTTVSLDECRKIYHGRVAEGQICARGPPRTGLCMGDSGGPLTYKNELIGIISWGEPCAVDGYPDVFTSVYYYLRWIKSVLQRH